VTAVDRSGFVDTTIVAESALISAAAERRQVTVVFVDLIGSSRLAQALDPEDFSDLIVAYRRAATTAIEAHRGFVARFLGDGILAYWGYPRAREQDPQRAVAAGLAIVAAMSDLNRQPPIAGVQLRVLSSSVRLVRQRGALTISSARHRIPRRDSSNWPIQTLFSSPKPCVS
jgi:class 3 adenylate cyclase